MNLESITESVNIPVLAAFLLGLLTAISPCPMATNIAAIAYITRRVTDRTYAIIAGSLYTLGRVFSYSVIGVLIIVVGLEIPGLSAFLQGIGTQVLGPVLILLGILMLTINKIPFGRGGDRLNQLGEKVAGWGLFGAFLLGVLFALAFCPYSGVLYFAVLIPLSLKVTGGVMLPAIFAIGTGLPVILFGTLLSLGVSGVSSWLNALTKVERVMRIVVALVFIGVGIYYVVLWIQS